MSSSEEYKIGMANDFPEGQAVAVDAKGLSVVVCHVEDKFYAVENRCSHDDAELCVAKGEGLTCGKLDGFEIVCPRHFARFDIRDGTVSKPPAIYPIETFDVKVRGQSVYLEIDS